VATVQTVAGPLDTARLGFTLMHEHIFVLSEGVKEGFPRLWNHEEQVAQAITKMRKAKAHGISTIVDLTVLGIGRNVRVVRDIAREAGMQVIAATALYTYDEIPRYFDSRSVEHMADPEHGNQGRHPQVRRPV